MSNPFAGRSAASLAGPGNDAAAVTPSDSADLPGGIAVCLYVETGGAVAYVTAAGNDHTVTLADNQFWPVGAKRIKATGTTATGIHAIFAL